MSEEVKQEIRLTKPQEIAVNTIDDNVAVSAGAGSGKTQVLSLRFLNILEKLGLESYLAAQASELGADIPLKAKAQEIMAITFTKKAATEMRERIRRAIDKRIVAAENSEGDRDRNIKVARFWRLQLKSLEKAHIDTLHSLCSKILRENPVDAGIDPQFRVAEDVEGKVFVKDTIVDFVRRGLRNNDEDITELARIYGYRTFCDNLYSLYSKIEDILADEMIIASYEDAIGKNRNGKATAGILIDKLKNLIDHKKEATNDGTGGRQKLDDLAKVFEQIKAALTQEIPDYSLCKKKMDGLRFKRGSGYTLKSYTSLMDKIDADVISTIAAGQIKDWRTILANLLQTVQAAKQKYNLMTFDDLEIRAVALMRSNPVICKKYADKFTHIMVDEFQDTNERQRQLIYMLCGGNPAELKGKKLFIVGDSKQSIYRFRGAEVQVFADVCKDIANNGVYYPMGDNFRSLDYVLDAVNGTFKKLMDNCQDRGMVFEALQAHRLHDHPEEASEENKLLLEPKKPEFIQILWPKGQDGKRKAEAIAIVKKMQEVNREFQAKNGAEKNYYGEMAILLRTMTDAGDIINTLQEQGIAYEMENKNFYELQEVLDIINLFKALISKNNDLELAGVLRSPYFGLDDTTLTKLFLADRKKKLWDNLLNLQAELTAEQLGLAQHARTVLLELKEAVAALGPIEVWEILWQKMHPDYILSCQPRGEIKLANVNILRTSCAEYCQGKGASLTQWLEHVAELRDNGGEEKALLPTNNDAVKIYSIHKSKGLEYPVVFVSQLDRKDNADRSAVRYLPKFGLGIKHQLEDGSLENTGILNAIIEQNKCLEKDERIRQMYVAMTRAKERLYLTGIVEAGEPTDKNPSGLKYAEWMGKLNNIYTEESNNFIEMVQIEGETEFTSSGIDDVVSDEAPGLTISDEYIAPLAAYLEGGRLAFSPSSLQAYLHCQRQYFYQYVMGLPQVEVSEELDETEVESGSEAAEALASGAAEALASGAAEARPAANPVYSKPSNLSPKDLGSIVHRALELYKGDLEPALQRAIQENAPLYQGDEVRKMLENYLASPLYKSIPKQQKRELAFAVYEKEGLLISGIIDCLGFNADGSLLLVDYKTGKPPVAGEVDKGYAYQLAIYEKVARERWGRAQAGKQAPKITAELHFLQNNTAWNLEKHTEAVDYYGEAIALCEEISHKTKEADFACRQYVEQGLGSSEENAQNAVTALAPCKYCPYNYVCNHK